MAEPDLRADNVLPRVTGGEAMMERALFGRQTEVATVTRLLDFVPSGPVALIIGGEAGIGKSTLWLEALSQARGRGYRVLSCEPTESEAKLSFAALGDLLRGIGDETLEALPLPQRSALEIALLRADAIGSPPDQRAVAAAFHGTLLALAAAGPCLIAIDDAQWLDAPSARVVEFAARRLDDAPIALILTARSRELESVPLGLSRALADDRLQRLVVGPMTPEATHEMLRSQLSTDFPRSVTQRIHETSAGNPFFALELGHALLRRGVEHEPGAALPVPANLRDLVKDRLSQLSGPVRQVLLIISAASQPTIPVVVQAIGAPTAEDDIEAAFHAGVIEGNGGPLRMTHPLLASVLHSESSGRTRRDVHRRLAAVVVGQEERALHLALAAEGPDEDVAAELEDAARRARGRGAPEAAAQLAKLARELTPPELSETRIHRTVHAGQYALEAAEMGQAAMLLEEAVDVAPPGWLQAEALLFLARVRYQSHDAGSARALAEQALVQAARDPELKTQIHMELAVDADSVGDRASARAHASAAVDLAEAQGDETALAESLSMFGLNDFFAGEGAQLSLMQRAVALEGTGGELRPLRSPTFRMACMLLWTDDLAAARSMFGDLEKRCREGGDEGSLAVVLFLLAQLECRAGNWARARDHADESCAITAWTGQQPYRAHALSAMALIAGHLGDEQAARAAAGEGLELARGSGLVQATVLNQSALGFLELSLGNVKEAHGILWPLAEGLVETGLGEPGMLRFLPDEIEALIALGDVDTAGLLLEESMVRATALGRTWALATGERCRGLLAASLHDPSGALAAFERAVRHHGELDEPFELARTSLARGQVLRRMKKWRLARESLDEASRIFDRLGAALWVTKAGAEVARIGGRAPSPTGLTPTELRLADLVASGLTNREAAQAMFVSVSTVEANLRRVYTKLGVRSRTELARRISEPERHGQFDPR